MLRHAERAGLIKNALDIGVGNSVPLTKAEHFILVQLRSGFSLFIGPVAREIGRTIVMMSFTSGEEKNSGGQERASIVHIFSSTQKLCEMLQKSDRLIRHQTSARIFLQAPS